MKKYIIFAKGYKPKGYIYPVDNYEVIEIDLPPAPALRYIADKPIYAEFFIEQGTLSDEKFKQFKYTVERSQLTRQLSYATYKKKLGVWCENILINSKTFYDMPKQTIRSLFSSDNANKTCIVAGNGPSLNEKNLKTIFRQFPKADICACWHSYGKVKHLKPKYIVHIDAIEPVGDFVQAPDYNDVHFIAKITSSPRFIEYCKEYEQQLFWYISQNTQMEEGMANFFHEAHGCDTGTVIGNMIDTVYFAGYKTVILIGVDLGVHHKPSEDINKVTDLEGQKVIRPNDPPYWNEVITPNGKRMWTNKTYESYMTMLTTQGWVYQDLGLQLYNASNGLPLKTYKDLK